MKITLLNWEKYNPRKDVKRPSWFRLEHDIATSPDFYSFSGDEFRAMIYIFCCVSIEREKDPEGHDGSFCLNWEHAERAGNLKPKALKSAFQKLEALQVILVDDTPTLRERDGDVQNPASTRRDETRRDETLLPDSLREPRRQFDFESLYQKYPRKEGKAKGIAKCKAQILTDTEFDMLSRSIDRYVAHIRKEGIEKKFIKHFSTFMEARSWRDWLEPEAGRTNLAPIATPEPEWEDFQRDGVWVRRLKKPRSEVEPTANAPPEAAERIQQLRNQVLKTKEKT